MTVETPYAPHDYSPGAAMAPEAVPWPFLTAAHLRVTHIADGDGAETVLTLGEDYTVGGSGPTGTGTVAATAAWPEVDVFRVERVTPAEQKATILSGQPLPAADVNTQLDRMVLIAQEVGQQISRAVVAAAGEPGFTLASTALRSGRIFAFAPDGTQDFQLTVAAVQASFSNVSQLQGWRSDDLARIVDVEIRALQVPEGETAPVLPALAARTNRLPRFDASGGFDAVAPASGPDWSVVVLDSAGAPHGVQLGDLIAQSASGDLDGGVWGDDPANLDGGIWA